MHAAATIRIPAVAPSGQGALRGGA